MNKLIKTNLHQNIIDWIYGCLTRRHQHNKHNIIKKEVIDSFITSTVSPHVGLAGHHRIYIILLDYRQYTHIAGILALDVLTTKIQETVVYKKLGR